MRADHNRNFPGGLLLIDKPKGMTSHDVVNRARRLFDTKQVGHTGTLDPLATGLLIVLVGRAVKASEYSLCDRKSYSAQMRLGTVTDTGDITGHVLSSADIIPSPDEVTSVLERFRGDIMQLPPMYSALKVNGKKLYDYAREGKTVERSERPITVYSLSAERIGGRDWKLDAEVSAGTYIRTLCEDIGRSLGCGATMTALRRTSAAGFSIGSAHTLDELEGMTPEERYGLLVPVEDLFGGIPKITLPTFYEKLFRSGCEIYFRKIGTEPLPEGTLVSVYGETGGFFAVGKVIDCPDGPAVKSDKLFVL